MGFFTQLYNMMPYLVQQFWPYVVFLFLVGIFVGWFAVRRIN